MDTKGHCFPKSIIIQAVYLKIRFSLSYRDVEEIMRIRGVEVDHATIQRWVFKFMPEIEIQMRKRKKEVGKRWRMDETYIKVKTALECSVIFNQGNRKQWHTRVNQY